MEPTVSVIISTYNGCGKLPHLLNALKAQTVTDFETIVVVDGSTDGTLLLLKHWILEMDGMQVVVQENSGRSKVRNRGGMHATGNLLIFYDDDMVPRHDSVQRHRTMHTDRGVTVVSGSQIELKENSKTDIQNYKANLTERWVSKYASGITQMNSNNLFFTAANCSISKKVFDELGGFNEQLTDAEDYDFAKRAMAKGIAVYFDKENVAIHRDYITARSYVIRLREYRAAHKILAQLPNVQSKKVLTGIAKRLIYRLFAYRFWVQAMDGEWFKLLPRLFRYKMYDVILHSLSVEYPEVKI
jgi:GT2 family glycosyltransferase